MKICTKCSTSKPVSEFSPRYNRRKGKAIHSECKLCNTLRKKTKLYGISKETYLSMFLEQNDKCAICLDKTKLNVDHCHKTKKVRGLLCFNCNIALGKFKDNPELLLDAAQYLVSRGA